MNKISQRVLNGLLFVAVISLVYFAIHSVSDMKTYKKITEESKELSQEISKEDDTKDFDKLCEINPDIAAWITIPDTPVDYPVVMAKDNNSYYLTHDIEGNYSQYGSVFTDYRIYDNPLEQKNCIIYGHNMGHWTDVMFGSLMEYEDEDFYQKHREVVIYTPGTKNIYQIVSVREVNNNSYAYEVDFDNENEFREWYEKSIQESMYTTNLPENSNSIKRVITLSTCTFGTNKLVLVCINI